MTAAYEDVALWQERDISHSSVERVILPDATMTLYYMLDRAIWLMRGLVVDEAAMQRTFEASHHLVYSERVLLALIERGMSREEAYLVIQRLAMEAWDDGKDFRDLCHGEGQIRARIAGEELDRLFDPQYYLRNIGTIYARFGLEKEVAS